MADEIASLSEEDLAAATKQAEEELVENRRPTRTELILKVDPSWQEGSPTSHLLAITGLDGSVDRYVLADAAPGIADA